MEFYLIMLFCTLLGAVLIQFPLRKSLKTILEKSLITLFSILVFATIGLHFTNYFNFPMRSLNDFSDIFAPHAYRYDSFEPEPIFSIALFFCLIGLWGIFLLRVYRSYLMKDTERIAQLSPKYNFVQMLEELKSGNEVLRAQKVLDLEHLMEFHSQDVLKILNQALSDPSPLVRYNASKVLQKVSKLESTNSSF